MSLTLHEQDAVPGSATEDMYVARQPVFDPEMRVWGYELLFRQSARSCTAEIGDLDVATAQVMVNGFSLAAEWLTPRQKVLINYPENLLLQGMPRALPAETAVVEILETVRPNPEVLEICRQLKDEGYTLALDDFVGGPGFEPLLELADIVKVDVLGVEPGNLDVVVGGLLRHRCTLLAEKVENLEVFHRCRDLGFTLFQGYFFSRPQIVAGKNLSSSQTSRLNLLQALGAPDLDMTQITKIIQADVSLSYRLLRYINSPGIGLPYQVRAITQAANMLGQRRIALWLRVLILADMNPALHSRELLSFCLQRARFLEMLSQAQSSTALPPDSMFLFGLFSSLDALLSQPMPDIIGKLSLEPRLARALLGDDPELQTWLDLALASESGSWSQAEMILDRLGIERDSVAKAQNKATSWAKHFMEAA
ncbi:EAL and HDOD domain-containing protein [Desulfonatronum thiodismutans]|uniref:EAL and HDOD domain-containing protein n=1 Tax=Desulfonatronum thiodismutans TaxID=159290 RepID=UPI00068B1414|nr:HDOD domain-containing protein [Desulfonatronum thiodismutans]